MALTATLDNVNPGVGIVKPLGRVSSVFGTLANAGKGLADAYLQNQQYADTQETKNALNDAEQKAFDQYKGAALDMEYSRVANTAIPDEVIAAGTKLDKVKGAVNQGSLPSSAINLHLENTIDELFQLHPENKAAIAQYFQSRGYDHYVFRDLKNQMEWQEKQQDNVRTNEEFVIDAAVKAGLVSPNDPRSLQLSYGQEYLRATTEMKMLQDRLTMQKTKGEIDAQQRKFVEDDTDRLTVQAFVRNGDLVFGKYTRDFTALLTEAQLDPTGSKWTEVQKSMPLLAASFQEARSRAVAEALKLGAKPDVVQQIKEYYDTQYNGFVNVFSGELSDVKTRQSILTSMQTTLGIDAAKAFPLYTEIAKLPGMQNSLPLLFGGDPSMALSPEVVKALKSELNGWAPGSMTGMYHVQRIASLLRGDLSLKSMSQEEAQKALPGLLAGIQGNRQAILKGDISDGTTKGFMNGYANTLDAAFALQPGSALSSQKAAASIVGHQETWNALEKLAKDPNTKQQANDVIDSAIGTAAKGLEVAKMTGGMTSDNGIFKIEYNYDRRRFEVKADRSAFNRTYNQTSSSVARFGYMPGPTFEEVVAKGDSKMNDKAAAMNGYLVALLRSREYNQDIPQNAGTLNDYAAFFAKGTPLPKATPEQSTADFSTRLNKLTSALAQETLTNLENQSVQDITTAAAQEYGISPTLGNWLIGAEGTGRTQIDVNKNGKPDSTATGYGQFIDGTAREYGLLGDGFDYRNDPTKAIPASMRYLSDLIRQNGGDVLKALHQYGVLDRRNFPSGPEGDAQYQRKLESAKKAAGLG